MTIAVEALDPVELVMPIEAAAGYLALDGFAESAEPRTEITNPGVSCTRPDAPGGKCFWITCRYLNKECEGYQDRAVSHRWDHREFVPAILVQ